MFALTIALTGLLLVQQPPPALNSKLAILDLKSRKTEIVFTQPGILEAPNWSRDGRHLLVNTGGRLYRFDLESRRLTPLLLPAEEYRCNNDHDYSPDGKLVAFSASTPGVRQSQVFVANADGSGPVRLLTPLSPSYFHGWSRDGKWLAYVGRRDGKFELFRVAVSGGDEQRLTSAGAYDDGPEYSPDGKWIYFNSNRGGGWNIWRMPVTGAGASDTLAERVTNDALEDWFPHFSPDGKQMVFLSFPAGTEGHNGRMPGMQLRLQPRGKPGAKIRTLVTFFGGQGTINVNSWSPDSKKLAYVIYEPSAGK